MAPESNRSIAVGLSLAAGILMINLWMRNQSDTDSETAAACGNNTKDEVSGSFSKKTASDSSLGNDDTKSEEVDLHGRPWRAKGVGKHARAQHWTSRPSTANAWGVDEANAMANEQPLVVPRDSRTGALLPITAATLPQWLTVVFNTYPPPYTKSRYYCTASLLYLFLSTDFNNCGYASPRTSSTLRALMTHGPCSLIVGNDYISCDIEPVNCTHRGSGRVNAVSEAPRQVP
jgi:hypothetical protein